MIIEPFRKAILEMEKTTYPSLPGVIFVYQMLLKSFMRVDDDDDWIQSLKKRLLDSVKKKLIICDEHCMATILHPSFWLLQTPCVPSTDKRRSYTAIHRMVADDVGQQEHTLDNESGPSNSKRSRVA